MDLYDKQFCNGDFVLLANSHKHCLQLTFWEAVVADIHVMVIGISKPAQVFRSVLLCANHNRGLDKYVLHNCWLSTNGIQVLGLSSPCEQKITRPIHITTHWHHWVCQWGWVPPPDLTVTHLYQQTTTHHSDTTWDMRPTTCVVLYPAHFLKMVATIRKMVWESLPTFLAQWCQNYMTAESHFHNHVNNLPCVTIV